MAALKWLPRSITDTTDAWDWDNTVTSAMGSLAKAGQDLMQPVGQHIASAIQAAQGYPESPGTRFAGGLPGSPQPPPPPPQPAPPPQLPAVKPFSLGSIEDWLGPKPVAPAPAPEPAAPPVTQQAGAFKLPDPGSFFSLLPGPGMGTTQASSSPAATATAAAPGPAPSRSYPEGSWDARAHAAAVAAGHPNPAEFVEQMRHESAGFSPDVIAGTRDSSAGARGIAQVMPAVARAAGINPLDPDAALTYAATRMAQNYRTYGDSDHALAEYNMGAGNLQKYGPRGLPETQKYLQIIQGATPPRAATPPSAGQAPGAAAPPPPGTYTPETAAATTVNQVTQGKAEGLTSEEALAVCGPAAAVAFSRANGRNPTLREAKELAQNLGLWDVGAGMHGPASQVQLLEKMGVPSRLAEGADEATLAREVQAGRPAIIDTPQHYFVATNYDPQTRQFDFGESAKVLRASGGRTRYRLDEIASLGMGSPRASIFMRDR